MIGGEGRLSVGGERWLDDWQVETSGLALVETTSRRLRENRVSSLTLPTNFLSLSSRFYH
jgi:hypothetical protein